MHMHTSDRKILFIEPFSGISGDMMVAALLDLGFSFEELRAKLSLLPLKGYQLTCAEMHAFGHPGD